MIYEKTYIIRIKIMRKWLPVIMVVTPCYSFAASEFMLNSYKNDPQNVSLDVLKTA